jgi:hypothetical protein
LFGVCGQPRALRSARGFHTDRCDLLDPFLMYAGSEHDCAAE